MAGPLDAERREVLHRAAAKIAQANPAKLLLARLIQGRQPVERPVCREIAGHIVPHGPEPIVHVPGLGDPPRLAVSQLDPVVYEPRIAAALPFSPQPSDDPPEHVGIAAHAHGRCRRHERPHVLGLVVANPGEPPARIRHGMKGIEHPRRREARHALAARLPAAVEQNLPAALVAHHHEASRRLEPHPPIGHSGLRQPEMHDPMRGEFGAVVARHRPQPASSAVDRGFCEVEVDFGHGRVYRCCVG